MKYSRFVLKNVFKTVAVALSSFVVFSCSSLPENIPDDDREVVQLAQDAAESGNTKLAKWYYSQLLEKYSDNPKIYVEANFEIAHLDIKQKKYEDAVPRLNRILYLYANVAPGYLPGQYKKLAENDLAKIPEETLAKINEKIAEAGAVDAMPSNEVDDESDDDIDFDEESEE